MYAVTVWYVVHASVQAVSNSLLPARLLILKHVKLLYHTCIYNPLPEDEPSGSKHVEDIKMNN